MDAMVDHTPLIVFLGGEKKHVHNATLSVPQLLRTKVGGIVVMTCCT